MLSIIIPTYNYCCTNLVKELAAQAEKLHQESDGKFDFEIIVADDCSTDQQSISKNQPINRIPKCRYTVHPRNTGRAYVCNGLIDEAKYNHLLLIDSDAAVCSSDFIKRYWETRDQAVALCGGIRNPQGTCPKGCELRFRYEHNAENQRKHTDLNANPYFRLSTFNIFINKNQLGTLRFDERCKEYGYEDALLGLTMQEKGLSVVHIDNPLIHMGIDTNVSFIRKTEASMRTLHGLKGLMQDYAGTSRIHQKLKRYHLLGFYRICYRLFRPLLLRNLKGRHPFLLFFQLYKLGYYSELGN